MIAMMIASISQNAQASVPTRNSSSTQCGYGADSNSNFPLFCAAGERCVTPAAGSTSPGECAPSQQQDEETNNPSQQQDEETNNPNNNSGGGSPITLPNPLGDDSDFFTLLDRFINVLTIFAAPILVALIVVAGFYYMLGGDDPAKRKTAISIIKYGIIGFIVIIFARGIAAIVQGVL